MENDVAKKEEAVCRHEGTVPKTNTFARNPKTKAVIKEIFSWLVWLGAAALIAQLIHAFVFIPVHVDGNSMNDTLANGEVILVTKPEYIFGEPGSGEVVICRYPEREEYFVKRLIGIPGDVIEIVSNQVYRNGIALEEAYVTPMRNKSGFSMPPVTLDKGEYLVMGDNRDNSNDSRNYNGRGLMLLTRNQIIGRVRTVVFPFDKIRKVE